MTVAIVLILFPGGPVVLSALCLGILNIHRRFALSLAPYLEHLDDLRAPRWCDIVTLSTTGVLLALAPSSEVRCNLVQLPAVLAPWPDPLPPPVSEHVRTPGNFVPCSSAGRCQISAYIDSVLASLLPTGAVTGLANAQLLYTLPVSLFGMSISAAALPEMSGAVGLDALHVLRDRVNTGLRHIAFFVVPSAVVFLSLGDVVAAALFQTGRFTSRDAVYVWGILAGSSIGLLATTLARLYSSTYYALRDTRTPLRFALVHVAIATLLGMRRRS